MEVDVCSSPGPHDPGRFKDPAGTTTIQIYHPQSKTTLRECKKKITVDLRIWGPNLSVKNKLGEKCCSTNSSGSYVHNMRATTEVLGWLLSRLTQENDMS